MQMEFDPGKSERNPRERGLPFERVVDFDFATAVTIPEFRNGEMRYIAVGYLENRLHVLCFKEESEGIRVISFRKANQREAKRNGLTLRR